MPDEQSEKMVRLLEEIRDLAKERHEKVEAFLQKQMERQMEETLMMQSIICPSHVENDEGTF
jgi:hypothetical protein